jgi:hypothetical protein
MFGALVQCGEVDRHRHPKLEISFFDNNDCSEIKARKSIKLKQDRCEAVKGPFRSLSSTIIDKGKHHPLSSYGDCQLWAYADDRCRHNGEVIANITQTEFSGTCHNVDLGDQNHSVPMAGNSVQWKCSPRCHGPACSSSSVSQATSTVTVIPAPVPTSVKSSVTPLPKPSTTCYDSTSSGVVTQLVTDIETQLVSKVQTVTQPFTSVYNICEVGKSVTVGM